MRTAIVYTENKVTHFKVSFQDDGKEKFVRCYSQELASDRKYMLNDIEAWLNVGESPRF